MLRSRWIFSITLAASATLILDASKTPAVMILEYVWVIIFNDSSSSTYNTIDEKTEYYKRKKLI